jgi:putative NADH-flavin reductase
MNKNIKIAIIGGGGRTGKFLVSQLIEQGYHLKLLLRNPQHLEFQNNLIEIVQGDALDPIAVDRLVKGCTAVISTVGQRPGEPLVARKASSNVLAAMERYKVSRYILLAGLNIDTPFDKKGPETIKATEWMKSNYPSIQEDRQQTYELIASSKVDWILVRVPFIVFKDAESELIVSLADSKGSTISAGLIARFLINQLTDDKYLKKSPFIAEA